MVKVSVDRLPRELKTAYLGLALAPKRLPLDDALFSVLSGCTDATVRQEWKEALASHSLLQLAQNGTCMVHDVQLDYLVRVDAPAAARDRLREWLTTREVIDRLNDSGSLANTAGGSLGTFALSVAALWRRLCGTDDAARAAGEALRMAPCLQRSAGEDDEAALARAALQSGASILLHQEMGGSLQVAQWLCEQSLRTYREKLGDKHPNTLTSINNLGNCCTSKATLLNRNRDL